MLRESIKGFLTIIFLLMVGYFILNIFPSYVFDCFNIDIDKIKDNVYSEKPYSKFRDNLLEKAEKFQEDSESVSRFIKKYTGIDMEDVADRFFNVKSYELKENK